MALGQESQSEKGPGQNQAPPRSDREKEANDSSSRDTRIDLSPPKDDAKNHPESSVDVAGPLAAGDASDVQEFHPWNPHKAIKDIEIGDYYYKKKNYRAALDRYREAQDFKPNDALSNFRMAQCFEKLDNPEEAASHYEAYLKLLPHGPFSGDARKALDKLKADQKGPVGSKAQLDSKP